MSIWSSYHTQDYSSFGSSIGDYGGSTQAKAGGGGQIASGVIGGLTEIATGLINAKRTKQTYKFNAAMAELQGRMVRLSADVEIKGIRKRAKSLFSSQRALYAKAGVKMEGSPAAVMMNSLKEAELDAIYLDISATYNVGLTQSEADIYRMKGRSAQRDSYMKMGKTLLGMYTEYQLSRKR